MKSNLHKIIPGHFHLKYSLIKDWKAIKSLPCFYKHYKKITQRRFNLVFYFPPENSITCGKAFKCPWIPKIRGSFLFS